MAADKSSPNLQIRHNLSGSVLAHSNCLHPIVMAHCAQWNFTFNGVGHYIELIGAHTLKNEFVPALEVNLSKSYHSQ